MSIAVVRSLAYALFNGLRVGEPSSCWPWERGLSSLGYGKLKYRGKDLRAHRVSYELHKGPIPGDLVVRHSCDNPACCNPNHLLVGTRRDNSLDMVNRRRHTRAIEVAVAKAKTQPRGYHGRFA